MEFLDIKLRKDSSILLHAIHSVSTNGFLKENQTLFWFSKYKQKNLRNEKYHFAERKNEGRKLDKNSSLRRLEFIPRNLE